MLMLLVLVFSGCGQQKKAEVADSDDWRDAQVMIHGTRFKDVGNMTVADLDKLGFMKVLVLSDAEPGQRMPISVKAKDGDNSLYDFMVINKSDKKEDVDKCYIDTIYIRLQSDEDTFKVATDSSLVNGVTVGMTADEVRKIMGEPDNEKINEEKPNIYKTWTYNTNSCAKGIKIIFDKDTDVANIILIKY